MLIRSVALAGFLGYRDRCSIELDGKQTIGIVGENESGKSTILQAICYGLYGRTRAEREVQLINDDASQLLVELSVELANGEVLEIERGRTANNEAIISCSGIRGGPSTVGDYIREKLQVAYEDFIGLSYFVQGDIHQFMAGNKREYFQRWTSGLAHWKALEVFAGKKENEYANDIKVIDHKIEAAKTLLMNKREAKADLERAKEQRVKTKRLASVISDQVESLKDGIREIRTSKDLKALYESLRGRIDAMQSEAQRLKYESRRKAEQRRNIGTGVCPVLSTHPGCDLLEKESNDRCAKIDADLTDIKRRIEEIAAEEGKLVEKMKRLRVKIEKDRQPLSEVKTKLRNAEHELIAANRELRLAQQAEARCEATVENIKAATDNIDRMQQQRKSLGDEERLWRFVRYMCGRGGIPAELLESELEAVEERCNWVLERLDYPKRMRFSGHKKLAGFERECAVCGSSRWGSGLCIECGAKRPRKRKEEPTVTILDGTAERPFALESGGAQVLQSFAVRLACSPFASALSGVQPVKIAMLDEVFAMLDAHNRQKLLSLIIDKLASEFGLQQQLVVSHQADVIDIVDHILVVRKNRGTSVAKWK